MTDIRLRTLAEADIVERSEYYRSEGSEIDGLRFFDAAIGASRDVGRMPRAGSPRIEVMAGIDGLRSRRLERLRCGRFYFERSDCVDAVRLLAYAQDLRMTLGVITGGPCRSIATTPSGEVIHDRNALWCEKWSAITLRHCPHTRADKKTNAPARQAQAP